MRYRWNYQAPTHNEVEAANSFAKELGIHPILCHLLQKRGITTVSGVPVRFASRMASSRE